MRHLMAATLFFYRYGPITSLQLCTMRLHGLERDVERDAGPIFCPAKVVNQDDKVHDEGLRRHVLGVELLNKPMMVHRLD